MSEKLLKWSLGGDTGISYEQIAQRAAGIKLTRPSERPSDDGDFGRCYRLLKAVPEININCMKGFNLIWDKIVDAWPELTRLHEAKNGQGVYDLLHKIEKPFWKDSMLETKNILYGEYAAPESKSKTIKLGNGVSIGF